MDDCIAVLNAGSSSIKFAVYETGPEDRVVFQGQLEQIGISPHLHVVDGDGETLKEENWNAATFDHRTAAGIVFRTCLELLDGRRVAAVGHRVVHGGTLYSVPTRIDAKVMVALGKLAPLAPLHQPKNLAAIEAIASAAPHVPQVACFDTAFHRTQPPEAQLFALPRKYTAAGVRRYGFHGLSYEYLLFRLSEIAPQLAQSRLVIAHLGSGASLCALAHGQSVANSMGFTAVDGLVMGTRCGTIDPGVLIYLMDTYGMNARAIEDLIYRQSGLLGVSGISSDMRDLRASSDPAALEAITLFIYRIVRELGSLTAALGGLDGLILSAGIGQNDSQTRAEIAAGCSWLGLELDPLRNARGDGRISTDNSRVSAWVIPTNEERMIARHTKAVLGIT